MITETRARPADLVTDASKIYALRIFVKKFGHATAVYVMIHFFILKARARARCARDAQSHAHPPARAQAIQNFGMNMVSEWMFHPDNLMLAAYVVAAIVVPSLMAVVCVCVIAHRSQQVVTYFVEAAFEKVLFATLATTLHTAKGQITSRLSEAVFKVP